MHKEELLGLVGEREAERRELTRRHAEYGLVELAVPQNRREKLLQETRSIILFGSKDLERTFPRAVNEFYKGLAKEDSSFRQWVKSAVGEIPRKLPEGMGSEAYMYLDARFQRALFVAEQLAICVDGREREILEALEIPESEREGFLLLDTMVDSTVESTLWHMNYEAELARSGGRSYPSEVVLSPVEMETLRVVLATQFLTREYLGPDHPSLEPADPF